MRRAEGTAQATARNSVTWRCMSRLSSRKPKKEASSLLKSITATPASAMNL